MTSNNETSIDTRVDTEDDDELRLSDQAIDALKQFYSEQLLRESENNVNDCDLVEENWQLSQFWYSEETVRYLADQVMAAVSDGLTDGQRWRPLVSIACISCPTLFTRLVELLSDVELSLFEFDTRFETRFGHRFVFYDYNEPLASHIRERFAERSVDLVIADPPFLSDECLRKVIETIEYLAKHKIIVCSGAVVRDLLDERLQLKQCEHFVPKHRRHLGNEFRCFSNFELKCQSHCDASADQTEKS